MNEERCVSCGEIIPEGRQVCYTCEHKAENQVEKMLDDLSKFTYGVNGLTLADHLTYNTIDALAEYLIAKGYRKERQGE